MDLPDKVGFLGIFVGERNRHGDHPLYEMTESVAHKRGMAGATVVKDFGGFGKSSRFHTAKVLGLSEDSPIVIEIIDKMEKIEAFLPDLDRIVDNGLVTLENVRIKAYRHNPARHPDTESNP